MKILIAEDDKNITLIMKKILENKFPDIEKKWVITGLEALEIIKDFSPDLVISDLMMPNMNGIELLRAIRSNKELRETKAIFVSAADPESELAQEARSFLDVQFLEKPFSTDQLAAAIQNAIV